MKFTGLTLCLVAAFAASAFAVEVGPDDVEIIFYKGGERKGSVWPTDSGELDTNIDDYDGCSQPVLMLPGFSMGRESADYTEKATVLSTNSNYNVLMVNYNNSHLVTAPVITAPQIVQFLQKLMAKYNFDKSKIIMIAFSLGTVVSGEVGRELGGVGKILAFDPCGLQFDYFPNSMRLDDSDADLLVCMHTTDLIGTKRNTMCDVNLIWDGGQYPHGCPDTNMFCGHTYALKVMLESFQDCQYDFTLCDSYENYMAGACDGNVKVTLDVDMKLADNMPRGNSQYFYESPVNLNVTNMMVIAYPGSTCTVKRPTVNYDGKFC